MLFAVIEYLKISTRWTSRSVSSSAKLRSLPFRKSKLPNPSWSLRESSRRRSWESFLMAKVDLTMAVPTEEKDKLISGDEELPIYSWRSSFLKEPWLVWGRGLRWCFDGSVSSWAAQWVHGQEFSYRSSRVGVPSPGLQQCLYLCFAEHYYMLLFCIHIS